MTTQVFDSVNQLTGLINASDAGTTNFVWDEDSRLAAVKPAGGTPVTFTYNAEGKRFKKEG